MKSRILKNSIGSFIFLILIFISLLLVKPVIDRIRETMVQIRSAYLLRLEQATGLGISYGSLSPSVLSAFRINDIDIYDSVTKETLVSIHNAVLFYDIRELLKGSFDTAFTKLIVSGVGVQFDAETDMDIAARLYGLIYSLVPASDTVALEGESEKEESFSDVFMLPFDVEIRSVSLYYQDKNIISSLFFRKIELAAGQGNSFAIDVAGRFSGNFKEPVLQLLPDALRRDIASFAGNFAVSGNVFQGFDGSVAKVQLSSLGFPGYTFPRVDFLMEYIDKVVRLSTIQRILPFYLQMQYDTATSQITAHAEADRFNPFDVVSARNPGKIISYFQGSSVSGLYEFNFDPAQKAFAYSADGSLQLSENLYAGGIKLEYDLSGTEKLLSINRASASGQNFQAEVNLDVDFLDRQISGYADVQNITLPSGGAVQAELYFDPLPSGFMCFVPQLYLDDRSFTAVQLMLIPRDGSVDFAFELSDYSHADYGDPGRIQIDGSVLLTEEKPYVQTSVSIGDFFLDSFVHTAAFFLPEEEKSGLNLLADYLEPYIMTNDMYVSTDLSSVVYNFPACVIANTRSNSEFLILSLDGSESAFRLSHFDMQYGKQSVQLSANADFSPDYRDVFFSSDFSVNSIPYNITGNIFDGNLLSITGSYGLEAGCDWSGGLENISGYLRMDRFLLSISDYIFSVSAEVSAARNFQDFSLHLSNFEIEESSGKLSFSPYFVCSGYADNNGFSFTRLEYSDMVSDLSGSGSIRWDIAESGFAGLDWDMGLASTVSDESYSISGGMANPLIGVPEETGSSEFNDWFFSAEIGINRFPMARVMHGQSANDVVSGSLAVTGTLFDPYVSLRIDSAVINSRTSPTSFEFAAALEDGRIISSGGRLTSGPNMLELVSADFSLADFSGFLDAHYTLDAEYTLDVPFRISVESDSSDRKGGEIYSVPDVFIVSVETDEIGGTLTGVQPPMLVSLIRTPGRFDLISSADTGISGFFTDAGDLSLSLKEPLPVHFDMKGSIRNSQMDLRLNDFYFDLSSLTNLVNYPFIMLHGGIATGWLAIGGILSDPEFSGVLTLRDVDMNCPEYVPEHIKTDLALATMENSVLRIDRELFTVGKTGQAYLDLQLFFDRWMFDHVEVSVKIPDNRLVPVDLKVPMIQIKGYGGGDLFVNSSLTETDISGYLFAQNTTVEIVSSELQDKLFGGGFLSAITNPQETEEKPYKTFVPSGNVPVRTKFTFETKDKVEIIYNPLLRGLIAPYTKLELYSDSSTGSVDFKGDATLRGGEIVYLNRNFYLREGRIVFNESGTTFDPHLTIRAETRERDQDGKQVRITLSAANQPLSEFSPSYSASPPKSEQEIMEILGQILSADIDSGVDVLLTGVDYGIQILGISKLEKVLRDLLNLDIFSLRTSILQNVSKQFLDTDSSQNEITIGNFFDNTTIYVGKYFGSSIYLDSLLHLSYDENKQKKGGAAGGIVFQPEFGLEMDAPFATIRFSIAPEIESLDIDWVAAASISLSWRFAL